MLWSLLRLQVVVAVISLFETVGHLNNIFGTEWKKLFLSNFQKSSIYCKAVVLDWMILHRMSCYFVHPCSFWQTMCIFFKIAFLSCPKWCQDRGSEYTTSCHAVVLCNLASSASPSHRVPIRSFPQRWNDSSNSPSLHRCSQEEGWSNYPPTPQTHTFWQSCWRAWTKLYLLYRLAPLAPFLLSPGVNRQPWPFIQAIMVCDRSHSSLAAS